MNFEDLFLEYITHGWIDVFCLPDAIETTIKFEGYDELLYKDRGQLHGDQGCD